CIPPPPTPPLFPYTTLFRSLNPSITRCWFPPIAGLTAPSHFGPATRIANPWTMHLRWLSAAVPNSLACAGPWTGASPISTYVIGSQQAFFIVFLPPEEHPRHFLMYSCKCWEAGGCDVSSVFVV